MSPVAHPASHISDWRAPTHLVEADFLGVEQLRRHAPQPRPEDYVAQSPAALPECRGTGAVGGQGQWEGGERAGEGQWEGRVRGSGGDSGRAGSGGPFHTPPAPSSQLQDEDKPASQLPPPSFLYPAPLHPALHPALLLMPCLCVLKNWRKPSSLPFSARRASASQLMEPMGVLGLNTRTLGGEGGEVERRKGEIRGIGCTLSRERGGMEEGAGKGSEI